MVEKRSAEVTSVTPAFTKAQLTASNRYASRKDLISTLLDDAKTYTTDEVDALIEKYLKGRVI